MEITIMGYTALLLGLGFRLSWAPIITFRLRVPVLLSSKDRSASLPAASSRQHALYPQPLPEFVIYDRGTLAVDAACFQRVVPTSVVPVQRIILFWRSILSSPPLSKLPHELYPGTSQAQVR